ncbi:MAG: 30S ribosomal protein S6 [Epsilonproteobacteria bacterium]|nr:30S ribosomal protein S6 [Campylobacterota bacterium]
MNHYETLFILKPTLTEQEINSNVEKIKNSLSSEGANILAIDDIGLRRLAYPVKKSERGIYYVLYYISEGNIISEFERKLRFNEDVLKFLTIKYRTKREIEKFKLFVSKIDGVVESRESEEKPKHEEESVKVEDRAEQEEKVTQA